MPWETVFVFGTVVLGLVIGGAAWYASRMSKAAKARSEQATRELYDDAPDETSVKS